MAYTGSPSGIAGLFLRVFGSNLEVCEFSIFFQPGVMKPTVRLQLKDVTSNGILQNQAFV